MGSKPVAAAKSSDGAEVRADREEPWVHAEIVAPGRQAGQHLLVDHQSLIERCRFVECERAYDLERGYLPNCCEVGVLVVGLSVERRGSETDDHARGSGAGPDDVRTVAGLRLRLDRDLIVEAFALPSAVVRLDERQKVVPCDVADGDDGGVVRACSSGRRTARSSRASRASRRYRADSRA